jgi:hypothetical protein
MKHVERSPAPLIIREMQIKPSMRHDLMPVRMGILEGPEVVSVGQSRGGKGGNPHTLLVECQLVQPLWKTAGRSLRELKYNHQVIQHPLWEIYIDTHTHTHTQRKYNQYLREIDKPLGSLQHYSLSQDKEIT